MSAVAHSFDDESPDPAEAAMSEADFRIIERAHQLCERAPAVDLEQRAAAICQRLCEELNEGALLRAIDALDEVEPAEKNRSTDTTGTREVESPETTPLSKLEVDPPVIDWAQIAADAWNAEGWAVAAVEYQVNRRNAYAWVRQ